MAAQSDTGGTAKKNIDSHIGKDLLYFLNVPQGVSTVPRSGALVLTTAEGALTTIVRLS